MNDKLIEELKDWIKERGSSNSETFQAASYEVEEILSRHKPQESLAELADRKGFWGITIVRCDPQGIEIMLDSTDERKVFLQYTYLEVEKEARQYLEGLEDHK